jgi:microcystin-dependent protein
MKRINLTTGGHPFQVDDLQVMEDGIIEALGAVAASIGNPHTSFIMQGCTQVGFNMQAGYIFFLGEVFPVDAQTIPLLAMGMQMYWVVQENVIAPSPVTYQDATVHNVHVRRTLVLQGAVAPPLNSILVLTLPRLNQILGLTPQAGIIMYSGSTTNFITNGLGKVGTQLDGWALCNGNNGTPNLKGRFIAGYDPLDADYNAIGNLGGSKTVSLINTQLPPHTHLLSPDIRLEGSFDGTGTARRFLTLANDSLSGAIGEFPPGNTHPSEDGTADGLVGGPHENRPSYYTLAYIMKLI